MLSYPRNGSTYFENIKWSRAIQSFHLNLLCWRDMRAKLTLIVKTVNNYSSRKRRQTKLLGNIFFPLFSSPHRCFPGYPRVTNASWKILCLKFSGVDCHCSGFLSVKNLSDSLAGLHHLAGQKSPFQYLQAYLMLRKVSLCSKRERVPLHALWLYSTMFPLLSFVGKTLYYLFLVPCPLLATKDRFSFVNP